MRVLAAIIIALTLAAPAEASCNLSSVRLSAGLVKVGDTDRRVIESRPDRTVQLQTPEGGTAGIRYDFHERGQTVQVHVRAGRVVRVCRVRE